MAAKIITYSIGLLLCAHAYNAVAQAPRFIKSGEHSQFPPIDQKRVVITFDQFKSTIKTGQKYDSLLLMKTKLNQALLLSDQVVDSLELNNTELRSNNLDLKNSLEENSQNVEKIKMQLKKAKGDKKKFAGLGLVVGLAAGILIF